MKFSISTTKVTETKSSCLLLPIFEDGQLNKAPKLIDAANGGIISDFRKNGDIKGKLGQCRILPVQNKPYKRVVLVGCGKYEEYSESRYKKAMTSALKKLTSTNHKSATSFLAVGHKSNKKVDYRSARIMAEVWHQISYEYTATNSKKAKRFDLIKLSFGTNGRKRNLEMKKGLSHGNTIGSAIQKVRYLGDLPANVCTPSFLVKEARKIASNHSTVSLKVVNEPEMKKLKMGALLSVTAGSVEPSRLIILNYQGGKSSQQPIVIVGKGVTFDSGGISIKSGHKMDEMKFDMCGGAAAIGCLQAVADIGLPINVISIIPACENLPSGNATKPGDIVTSMSGQTIEVLNTDAEGRLILADALTYCQRFKPKLIIDMATLTGACIVALGHHLSGLMSNSNDLANKLLAAGEAAGDGTWRLPLGKKYMDQLKSNFADVGNISGGGGGAGTVTAACFLQKFVNDTEWAHLDIAGVAWLEGSNKGATGRPVALISEFLIQEANKS
jgi:leucyl aminopeptidase